MASARMGTVRSRLTTLNTETCSSRSGQWMPIPLPRSSQRSPSSGLASARMGRHPAPRRLPPPKTPEPRGDAIWGEGQESAAYRYDIRPGRNVSLQSPRPSASGQPAFSDSLKVIPKEHLPGPTLARRPEGDHPFPEGEGPEQHEGSPHSSDACHRIGHHP